MKASYPRCSIKFTTAQIPTEFRSGSLGTFPYSAIPPTFTLFFLYEQDKQLKNIRSSDSWVTSLHRLSAWGCPAMAWWQGCFVCADLSCSGSSMMLRCSGSPHFLLPTSCSQNSFSATWGTLSVTFGASSCRGFHRQLSRSGRRPPWAWAERQSPRANLLMQPSTC